ncbi:DUF7282 domain-containing protein [Natronorubrum sulfidifaciens]|uniref:DUF7282 domain-containing protein n=1 Tax=Natronorubrum sulfidifaciens JCM 14089 TaxID=1230460 RepID=L9WCT3_9EURY|nr:hypothetical protein [Natronorubrum sulfidifaciens]ELY47279.1 hypothetical protein C495_03437 [Natronorubrum sulfidifaciens JCM 14089]
MSGRGSVAVALVAALLVTSVLAVPALGGSSGVPDGDQPNGVSAEGAAADSPQAASDLELVSLEPIAELNAPNSGPQPSLSVQQDDAVEDGVDDGIELAQSQGVEVSQEQREAALEGARESVVQHQQADVEQVQEATTGAVHGSLMQAQQVEAEQVQFAVSGATDGALAQYQTVSASQMQSATWGAAHGAVAQEQRVTVEQIQVATRGAAAGAASEAGDKEITHAPKIQEAAQGAAYGVLEQYQQITVEQRQQVTLEHVQYAAAGASAGALEGSSELGLEQEQRVEVEQYQRATVKQIQKAATGAAKGALVQQQTVTVEQTQAAAHGASKGALIQVQSISIEQVQRISITQIQEASFGAAKGSITQSQEATVEQIQAAADGAAGGVLVQQQEVSITQIQHAAIGASQGALESAIQQQVVNVEQIQAASFGAGEGAVIQKQVIDVTQVQVLAAGSASGVLVQHQEATVEQLQFAASAACQETARAVQYQRISITQLQVLTQDSAADATAYAVQEEIDDDVELSQFLAVELTQRVETIDELEGEAMITFADQERDGDSVVVDSVELSEGGFVAIYDGDAVADPAGVLGSSDYLEPGAHSEVEIDLETPIEDDQPLVAVVHHETTGDETFQYAASDGTDDEPYVTPVGAPVLDTALVTVGEIDEPDEPDEAEPEATLEVGDQTGDGETVVVDEASADVEYTVTATADDTSGESDTFEVEETVTGLDLALEPPLEESTTVDVAVVDSEGDELATETIEYTLEDEPEPEATLEVSDQTGDGETAVVDEASAGVDYRLIVIDEDGEQRGESEVFEATETAEFESLALEPPLEANTTLEIAIVDTAGDELATEPIEYTLDGDPATFDVEFIDCSQAAVTGSFDEGDTVIVATGFYESGGFGNTLGEYAITVGEDVEAPFEGTITYEPGEEFTVTETDAGATVTVPEGDFGVAITGFASPDAVPGEIDYPNPDASECLAEVRPELPTLSVEETTPSEDGIDVTFGYENPNDATLVVDSEFLEGATADEPVDELEPGTNTFTVEWTPETDDERLVWAVDMSRYDYDADAVEPAATATAGELAPSEPAEFAVSITGTNDPLEQGEPLEVDAEIENVGGEAGTQEIELAVGNAVVDTDTVSLEPDESTTLTLTADTATLEPGDYPVTVSSEDALAETTVTVDAADEPEPPVEDDSSDDSPFEEDPGDDGPFEEDPGDDSPFEEDPGDDSPFEEDPGDDSPFEEDPSDDSPFEEDPGDDSPFEEDPSDDSPFDDDPFENDPFTAVATDGIQLIL